MTNHRHPSSYGQSYPPDGVPAAAHVEEDGDEVFTPLAEGCHLCNHAPLIVRGGLNVCSKCGRSYGFAGEQVFVCGSDGKPLAPEARAEIDAFTEHLREHEESGDTGCRFCVERSAKRAWARLRGGVSSYSDAADPTCLECGELASSDMHTPGHVPLGARACTQTRLDICRDALRYREQAAIVSARYSDATISVLRADLAEARKDSALLDLVQVRLLEIAPPTGVDGDDD